MEEVRTLQYWLSLTKMARKVMQLSHHLGSDLHRLSREEPPSSRLSRHWICYGTIGFEMGSGLGGEEQIDNVRIEVTPRENNLVNIILRAA